MKGFGAGIFPDDFVFIATLAIEVAVAVFVLMHFARGSKRAGRILKLGGLGTVLLVAAQWVVAEALFGFDPPINAKVSYQSGFFTTHPIKIHFLASESRRLHHERLRIIVIERGLPVTVPGFTYQTQFPGVELAADSSVARVESTSTTAPVVLGGKRRIFLIDAPSGRVVETRAPFFDMIWEHRQDLRTRGPEATADWLWDYLRALDPKKRDAPLRAFLRDPKDPPEDD